MAKNNYYAVRIGRNPGIYRTWGECSKQVKGYPGAQYKGFVMECDAEAYMGDSAGSRQEEDAGQQDVGTVKAYVDGSFNKPEGMYGWGAVILQDGLEIRLKGCGQDPRYSSMWNVAGEITAAMKAMEYCMDNGIRAVTIYHDYEGIAKWCTGEWKANKEGTKEYAAYYRKASGKVNISFQKVKGHSGDKYNDIADMLAKKGCGI